LNPVGDRVVIEENNDRVETLSYDALSRLIRVDVNAAMGSLTEAYIYDAVGNQTSRTLNGGTIDLTYDANDRLIQEGTTTFTYDDNGNPIFKLTENGTDEFGYDDENRLINVVNQGGTLTFGYDPDGNRVEAMRFGRQHRYLVDTNRPFAQVVEEMGDQRKTYVYGQDLLSQTHETETHFFHVNGLGSVTSLSDEAGIISDTYRYHTYGKLVASEGNTSNEYLFAGEQYDADLDMYYLRARYYRPDSGRFLTIDSWPGEQRKPMTLNKYLYGLANPANMIDPSGYESMTSVISAQQVGLILAAATVSLSIHYVLKAHKDLGYPIHMQRIRPQARNFVKQLPKPNPNPRPRIDPILFRKPHPNPDGEDPHGHHSVPRYVGGALKQRLIPMDPKDHLGVLHPNLRRWGDYVDNVLGVVFTSTKPMFDYKNGVSMRELSKLRPGRAIIADLLDDFYDPVWMYHPEYGQDFQEIYPEESGFFKNGKPPYVE